MDAWVLCAFTNINLERRTSMKFMTLTIWPVEKTAEVAAATDKAWAKEPKERRERAKDYVLLCVPFGVPPNSLVSVGISESDTAEEMAAFLYPIGLAGATVSVIPVLEVPTGGSAKTEKKYKG
jgi:hypothetical protein